MQTGEKRLQAYDNIMQNLLALKKQAVETRPGEASAIETILRNLLVIRDGEQGHGVLSVSGMQQAKDVNAKPSGLGKVAVHAK
jgi:hypothetical protein